MQNQLAKLSTPAARTDIAAPTAFERLDQTANVTVSICLHIDVQFDGRPVLSASTSLRCDMPMT